MRKKYGRIAVFVLGCVLAVWGMIIYPILNRGSVAVSFSNTTKMAFTILRINGQSSGLLLEAGGSATIDYTIQAEESIVIYLRDEIPLTVLMSTPFCNAIVANVCPYGIITTNRKCPVFPRVFGIVRLVFHPFPNRKTGPRSSYSVGGVTLTTKLNIAQVGC